MKKILVFSLMFVFAASIAVAQCPACRVTNSATFVLNNYAKSMPVNPNPDVINCDIRAAKIDVNLSNSAAQWGIHDFDRSFHRNHGVAEVKAYTNRNTSLRILTATAQGPLK